MELRRLRADLHIHTCLSPCGELSMSPRAVVARALEVGLDMIAVTDHNTTANAAAVIQAAAGTPLAVLPGIELTTAEEAHILGLFEPDADLAIFQKAVDRRLPDVPAARKFVKDQVLVDADDFVTGFLDRPLFGATTLDVRAAVDLIRGSGGMALACHIDREAFSLVSQLGFIPPDISLDGLEVSPRVSADEARRTAAPFGPLPVVRFSDAHKPEEIGAATTEFLGARPDLKEFRLALAGAEGRRVLSP